MEQTQQQFQCTGDCLKCIPVQRQYCASQHTYQSLRIIQNMQETVTVMACTIEELKEKINAIQANEALVFDPSNESPTKIKSKILYQKDKAQEAGGAEE